MALLLWTAASIGAETIDRTIAFVSKEPVLLSDVRLQMALKEMDEETALETVVDEFVMFEEAHRLTPQRPSVEAITREASALKDQLGARFSTRALERLVARQLVIRSYIDVRLRPTVRIEDSSLQREYTERFASVKDAPALEAVAEELRATLEREALERKIEEWIRFARSRASIRYPQKEPVR